MLHSTEIKFQSIDEYIQSDIQFKVIFIKNPSYVIGLPVSFGKFPHEQLIYAQKSFKFSRLIHSLIFSREN